MGELTIQQGAALVLVDVPTLRLKKRGVAIIFLPILVTKRMGQTYYRQKINKNKQMYEK